MCILDRERENSCFCRENCNINHTFKIIEKLSFPQCTACSECVLGAYRRDKFDFLVNVFTSSGADYLEELTGLAAMKNIDECDVIELSDDDF